MPKGYAILMHGCSHFLPMVNQPLCDLPRRTLDRLTYRRARLDLEIRTLRAVLHADACR